MPRPPVTPYAALEDDLLTRAKAGEHLVTLEFAAIEATILRRPLPASARSPRHHHGWWHGGDIHAWDGWLRAGWQVAAVDLAAGTVTFARRVV